MVREISYQTVGDGLTKTLKEAKKYLWPSFPIQCGVYALHYFKHTSLEIDNTNLSAKEVAKKIVEEMKKEKNGKLIKTSVTNHLKTERTRG